MYTVTVLPGVTTPEPPTVAVPLATLFTLTTAWPLPLPKLGVTVTLLTLSGTLKDQLVPEPLTLMFTLLLPTADTPRV